jgi:hypothetical protein
MSIRVASLLVLLSAGPAAAAGDDYPAPRPAADTSSYGWHIQRSMTLMATSTPQKRNTVRVLYYGQSITGQRWSDAVDAWLRKTYPNTDFVCANLALGGFASQLLVRTAEYDVMPFYPDLLIFHVYGSHVEYENLIREVRRRTTAEVIMQSDHVTKWPEPKAEGNFWQTQKEWDDKMNYHLLPAIAQKYRCAWHPQRWEWVQYLKDNNLQPKDLLSDAVHLNERGKWLTAELMKRFMVHRPDEPRDEWQDMVKTFEVGREIRWDGRTLRLEFEGNRVVALAAAGGKGGLARVLIDGKKPSEFPDCYTVTRPGGTPHVGWPALKRIGREKPPVLEEWTAKLTGFNEAQDDFQFSVTGSVTGADGEGRGKEKFVSRSGRVAIEPADWVLAYDRQVSKKPAPAEFTVRWKVEPLFVETYAAPEAKDPAREVPTVLVSNLPCGRHTLELVAEGEPPALKALRVHNPPVK